MNMKSMKKTGGLRKRWLLNTVGVVFALGLVCVMAVTASYATYYYSNMQSDMENRAKNHYGFFCRLYQSGLRRLLPVLYHLCQDL